MLKISSPTDTTSQMSMKQTKSCQFQKEIKTAQIAFTCLCIFICSFNIVIKFSAKQIRPKNHYLNNHINKTNQTPENNIFTKLITNTIRLPVSTIAKLSNKSHLHNRTEASALELKKLSDRNKAKTFNKLITNVTYKTHTKLREK